ncbi:hypothetical protein MSG28_014781 [Choristoneura fumiferana]|uniref:Uncharacterized protein n=2 Tax=Choristoneura fumiferana TaxID=7141 RepID=A0ACC0JT07_CHOFU|nr:hypothetical protein MSG28_014781 [Choristoneura fumiferana]
MESSACRRRASDADQSAAARAYSATAECEPVMVKEEPDCGVCGVSEAAMAEGLYADHEVKGELVIGPELLQQQDIIYSKHKGRKNNIILHGVEERETNNSELTNMVLGLLNRTNNKAQNETHEWDKWEISKLYRVGKKTVNKIRPIKITLTLTWRRNEILKNKKNFPKGTYITEDLPKEEVEIRKSLIPALKDARASGKYAIIRNGRLIIKDKLEKEKRKRIPSSPPSTPPSNFSTAHKMDSAAKPAKLPRSNPFESMRNRAHSQTEDIKQRTKPNTKTTTKNNKTTNYTIPNPAGPRGENDHNPPSNNKEEMKELKNGHQLKICTYNVRSLSTRERLLELNNAIENIDWDIIGLAEVRKMGHNIEEHENFILCYIGETAGLHGVGFMIKKAFKNNIVNFTGISERVAILKLKFGNMPLTIIQTYAPTENSSDFNAKIGHPKTEENLVMGKYGYGKRNKRGEKLIDYALEYKLSIMNTFFKKRAERKWTWMSPDKNTRNEIDFILSNDPKRITNYEVLNKVMFSSDHRPLRATLNLNQIVKSRKSFNTIPKTPKNNEEVQNYLGHLKTSLETNTLQLSVQDYYNHIEKSIIYSLKKSNEVHHKKENKIFSEHTMQLIKQRTDLMFADNKSKEEKKNLSNLFKETRKSIRKDYSMHRQEVITRNLTKFRSAKRALKELNLSKKWIQKLENNKKETKSRQDVIAHATNFYKELYRRHDPEDTVEESDIPNANANKTVEPIEEIEVYEHIRKLKAEKSPGPDSLTNEALKLGAPVLLHHLTQLFNMIIDSETVPNQWCTSDIILLYKKGNPLDIDVLVIKEESQYKPKLAGEPTPHPGAPTAAPGMALAAAAAPSSSTGSGAVLSDWSDYHWETCIEARRLMLAVIMCWLSKKRVHTSQS